MAGVGIVKDALHSTTLFAKVFNLEQRASLFTAKRLKSSARKSRVVKRDWHRR
jgi:hypothetical protein